MRRLMVVAALLFALPAHAVTIDWVTVGDPGNPADTRVASDGTSGYGSVNYVYRISKYEITNAQYTEFLNAVAITDTYNLYKATTMGSGYGGITRSGSSGSYSYSTMPGRENMPVNFVSFYDVLRFANWMNNGQGSGDTETGAYTLLGGTPIPSNGTTVTRNADATIFLTSEDEWYKAAYYDAVPTSYHDYPTGADVQTTCAAPGATANTANCNNVVADLTNVGSYAGSASPHGTFDQGGNVWEWNEAIIDDTKRGTRGGGFGSVPGRLLAPWRGSTAGWGEQSVLGARLAMIPELSTACDDGLDNDGDGYIDWNGGPLGEPADPGCANADDLSERSMLLVCDDGADNDGDQLIDFPEDPGCFSPPSSIEDPQCQDGINNDPQQDGWIDFDGGASAGLPPEWQTRPDPQCASGWQNREARAGCGLGTELALLLPPLMWMWRRRKSRN